MLVLARKKGEVICINDNIKITILRVSGDKVRVGIEAPPSVVVHREEVYEGIKRNTEAEKRALNKYAREHEGRFVQSLDEKELPSDATSEETSNQSNGTTTDTSVGYVVPESEEEAVVPIDEGGGLRVRSGDTPSSDEKTSTTQETPSHD